MAKKHRFAAATATMALVLSVAPMGVALGAPLDDSAAPDISAAQRLTEPESGYYGIAPTVATHPVSGETVVAEGDSNQSGITLFAVTEAGVQGTPVVLSASLLTSPLATTPSYAYYNSMFTVTPGPSGRWLLSYITESPSALLSLGFSVANGVVTVDSTPVLVDNDAKVALLSAAYGVSEGRYLLAYAKTATGILGLTTLARNAGDTGFDLKSDTETDLGFVSPNMVTARSLPSVADTTSGWIVAFGTGIGNTVNGAKWLTVSEAGTTLTLGTPANVSSSTSGSPLHPQVISTAEGDIVIFRYDSGVSGATDRYQVRGRWITGDQSVGDDIVFTSYLAPISKVRGAASDASLNLVWNADHNYLDGPERVVMLTTPLVGDLAEPVMVAPSESPQVRPDVAWSEALQTFAIVWLQQDAVDSDLYAVWLAFTTDPYVPEEEPAPGEEPAPEEETEPAPEEETEPAPETELAATGAAETFSWAMAALLLMLVGGLLVVRRRVTNE